VLDEYEDFAGVSGQYKVYDIEVFNRESSTYEPLDLTKTYTIAASNYYLLEYGSGLKMLENVKILQKDGMLYVEALELYISDKLGGTVGQDYAEANANITFTDGEIVEDTEDISKEENKLASLIAALIEVICLFFELIFGAISELK
jgi:2',3'-cyclic-nucleotide 2'-phosphodiesterase (5'-nucleotidase family)